MDKSLLQTLVESGMSTRELSITINKSQTTIRNLKIVL
jgi:hypothetical protein